MFSSLVWRRVLVDMTDSYHENCWFSLPLSNGLVTSHADCNEYQSLWNEEKSKNISTYYFKAFILKVKRRKIDIDRCHIDLKSFN